MEQRGTRNGQGADVAGRMPVFRLGRFADQLRALIEKWDR